MMNRFGSSVLRVLVVAAAAVSLSSCSLIPGFGGGSGSHAGVRRIAIVPFAYESNVSSRICDLCPKPVEMKATSRQSAILTTAFFFEELTHYPRFDAVETRHITTLVDHSMADAIEMFRVMDEVDAVLLGAVIDLRERRGNPNDPSRAAGATVYAALVEVNSGGVLWQGTFDADQEEPGLVRSTYRELVRGDSEEWLTAIEFAHRGAAELVRRMVDEIG